MWNKIRKHLNFTEVSVGIFLIFAFIIPLYSMKDMSWKTAQFSENLGAMGDFLAGTTTPFLTMAAFLVVYETYRLQKKSMEEMENGLSKQIEILQNQVSLMQKEGNKKTFFDLVDVFHESKNISCTRFKYCVERIEKYDNYFEFIEEEIFKNNGIDIGGFTSLRDLKEQQPVIYKILHESIYNDIMGYFIILGGIIDFINSKNYKEKKHFPANMDISHKAIQTYEKDVNTEEYNFFHTVFQSKITRYEKTFFNMICKPDNLQLLGIKDTVLYDAIKKYKEMNTTHIEN